VDKGYIFRPRSGYVTCSNYVTCLVSPIGQVGGLTFVCIVNFVLVTTNIDLGYKLELKLKLINLTIIVQMSHPVQERDHSRVF
jgi:hypothetical protein